MLRGSSQFADQKWLFRETSILHIVPGSNNVDWCWTMLDVDVQTNPTPYSVRKARVLKGALTALAHSQHFLKKSFNDERNVRWNVWIWSNNIHDRPVRSFRIEQCWMKLDYRISSVYNHGWRAQETSLVRIYCIPFLQCRGSIHCGPHWSSQL